jgi:hypothetical protein
MDGKWDTPSQHQFARSVWITGKTKAFSVPARRNGQNPE